MGLSPESLTRITAAVLALCGTFSAVSAQSAEEQVRVPLVGLEGAESDACPGIGRVNGLEPRKGWQLRVRSEANDGAEVTDELPVSTLVWLCESDEDWQGIVYPSGQFQELGDCRVSSALPRPEPYGGPCQFGWVEAKYVELVAS